MPRRGRAWVAAPVVLAGLVALVAGVSGGAGAHTDSHGTRTHGARTHGTGRDGADPHAAGAKARVSGASPACVPAHLNVSASLAGGHLTVSPAPASRDASAVTRISLLGTPAADIHDLVVRGSHTGVHAGRLVAFSQGDGAGFVPSRPFREGENVDVSARLQLPQSGGTVPVAWSFTVAVKDVPGAGAGSVFPPTGQPVHQDFVSAPGLRPPTVTVSPRASHATGDLFLAPYEGHGQYGPMILDEHGGLLWFDPLAPGARAGDLQVQTYHGQPVLTWWQDPLVAGGSHTAGGVIADSSYRQIAVVRAGNGYQPDLHEFQLTAQNTAMVTVYDAIRCDLSAFHGPRSGAVADTLFQEIDLATGLVRYEWHFLDHVPMSSSYYSGRSATAASPFDPFHINSVEVQHDGSFLVDARNTWAAYDVDAHTGRVRWQLGGKHGTFKLGAGVATAWQHDARQQPDGAITFFDNGSDPRVHPASRAIEVAIDTARGTATLVRSYHHPTPLVADSQGNVQTLANGDWVIGWGQAGYLSEVDPSGRLLFDAHLPSGWESYRAYVLPWSGRPTQPPSLALRSRPHGVTAYVSWNGATGVAAWRILAGASSRALAPLASAPRSGFETAIPLPASAAGHHLAVQALDARGDVLATSPAQSAPGS